MPYSAELAIVGQTFGVTLALLPGAMFLAKKTDMVDQPIHRKNHAKPIPYLGGVAVFLGIFLVLGFQAFQTTVSPLNFPKLFAVVGTAGAAALFGLLDDKFQVRARYKLAWQTSIGLAFVIFGYSFPVLRIPGFDPLPLGLLSYPFTLLWILTIVNGVNLIDGIDGLAATVISAVFLMLSINAYRLGDTTTLLIALTALGATCAFLVLNWKPAKIYLGDAGSTGLGMLVATSLVALAQPGPGEQESFLFQVPAVSMIAVYPFLEVFLSVFRRVLRGKSIGSADRSHIHHKLSASGWGAHHIALAAASITIVSGGILWANTAFSRGAAAWLVLLSGVAIGALIHFCGYIKGFQINSIKDARPHFLIANHFILMQEARLGLAPDADSVLHIIHQTAAELGVSELSILGSFCHTWTRGQNFISRFLATQLLPQNESLKDSDKIASSDGELEAYWTFLPRDLSDELTLEHRVLFSNFLKCALHRLGTLSTSF